MDHAIMSLLGLVAGALLLDFLLDLLLADLLLKLKALEVVVVPV